MKHQFIKSYGIVITERSIAYNGNGMRTVDDINSRLLELLKPYQQGVRIHPTEIEVSTSILDEIRDFYLEQNLETMTFDEFYMKFGKRILGASKVNLEVESTRYLATFEQNIFNKFTSLTCSSNVISDDSNLPRLVCPVHDTLLTKVPDALVDYDLHWHADHQYDDWRKFIAYTLHECPEDLIAIGVEFDTKRELLNFKLP